MVKILILLLLSGPAQSAQDPCRDLYAYSCQNRMENDGTGTVRKINMPLETSAAAVAFLPKVTAAFTNQLLIDGAFSQRAANAFGKPADCAKQTSCLEKLANELARETKKSAFIPVDSSPLASDDFYSLQKRILRNQVMAKLIPIEVKNKTDQIFADVKTLIIARLEEMEVKAEARHLIIEKISSINLDLSRCAPNIMAVDGPKDRYNQAYYMDDDGAVKVCDGFLLGNSSEFAVAFALAHEITHSIDTCHINDVTPYSQTDKQSQARSEKSYPLKGLIEKLRTDKNIQAKRNGAWDNLGFCQKEGFKKDQINESVADWMAAEVLPAYVANKNLTAEQIRAGYANALKSECRNKRDVHFDTHLDLKIRMNGIILGNLKIKDQMVCSP